MMKYCLFPLVSISFTSARAQNSNYSNLCADQFKLMIKNKEGSLLDVRTESKFTNGHIEGAGQLNYYNLNFIQKLLLPKSQPVFLYYNTIYKSKRAVEILVEHGYKHIYNLKHGIMEWNLYNLQVVVKPGTKPDEKNISKRH